MDMKMGNNADKQTEKWYNENGAICGGVYTKEQLQDIEGMMKPIREKIKTGKKKRFCIEFLDNQSAEEANLIKAVENEGFYVGEQIVKGYESDEYYVYYFSTKKQNDIPSVGYR